MKKMILLASLISSVAFAQARQPAVSCILDRSTTLKIYQNPDEVVVSKFMQGEYSLVLESFNAPRCPKCFQFSGYLGGGYYTGATSSMFANGGMQINLDLKIDNVQRPTASCR